MLSYDLCRQLKEAGFPQKDFIGCDDCGYCNAVWEREPVSETGRWCYRPTLEDLIRELGEGFSSLDYGNHDWEAVSLLCDSNKNFFTANGPTPEEALARLYLATRRAS